MSVYRHTSKWRRLAKKFAEKVARVCYCCAETKGLQRHHLQPVSRGGDPFRWLNLVWACPVHHAQRHSLEEAQRIGARYHGAVSSAPLSEIEFLQSSDFSRVCSALGVRPPW